MLAWFESDGTTPLGSLPFGKVGPGETYSGKHDGPLQVVLKNTGATSIADVAIEIRQVSAFPLHEYVLIAEGDTEPAPEAFVDSSDPDLEVGTLAASATAKIWLDLSVPLVATRGVGQFASLRAYGSES